jgi:hypothetical protein
MNRGTWILLGALGLLIAVLIGIVVVLEAGDGRPPAPRQRRRPRRRPQVTTTTDPYAIPDEIDLELPLHLCERG